MLASLISFLYFLAHRKQSQIPTFKIPLSNAFWLFYQDMFHDTLVHIKYIAIKVVNEEEFSFVFSWMFLYECGFSPASAVVMTWSCYTLVLVCLCLFLPWSWIVSVFSCLGLGLISLLSCLLSLASILSWIGHSFDLVLPCLGLGLDSELSYLGLGLVSVLSYLILGLVLVLVLTQSCPSFILVLMPC